MAKQARTDRLKPRILRGFRDIDGAAVRARDWMIARIREVYERYGFVPLETPALEYVKVLGKFLPESDTPSGGIFAFRDEDAEWVALGTPSSDDEYYARFERAFGLDLRDSISS